MNWRFSYFIAPMALSVGLSLVVPATAVADDAMVCPSSTRTVAHGSESADYERRGDKEEIAAARTQAYRTARNAAKTAADRANHGVHCPGTCITQGKATSYTEGEIATGQDVTVQVSWAIKASCVEKKGAKAALEEPKMNASTPQPGAANPGGVKLTTPGVAKPVGRTSPPNLKQKAGAEQTGEANPGAVKLNTGPSPAPKPVAGHETPKPGAPHLQTPKPQPAKKPPAETNSEKAKLLEGGAR